jgi:hypothetical protein
MTFLFDNKYFLGVAWIHNMDTKIIFIRTMHLFGGFAATFSEINARRKGKICFTKLCQEKGPEKIVIQTVNHGMCQHYPSFSSNDNLKCVHSILEEKSFDNLLFWKLWLSFKSKLISCRYKKWLYLLYIIVYSVTGGIQEFESYDFFMHKKHAMFWQWKIAAVEILYCAALITQIFWDGYLSEHSYFKTTR